MSSNMLLKIHMRDCFDDTGIIPASKINRAEIVSSISLVQFYLTRLMDKLLK